MKQKQETKRLEVERIRGIFTVEVRREPVLSCWVYILENSDDKYFLVLFPPGNRLGHAGRVRQRQSAEYRG